MTAKNAPRLAIVGCGAVVQHHLLPALRRIGWNPSVLVDPSRANLAAAQQRAPGGKALITAADWSQVAGAFDAAIVAAPHVLHGPIGLGLVRSGKHVFMEKPLAITTAECNEIIAAAEAGATVLSVGLLRRYLQVTRWTKALIDSGTLGAIRRFDAREGSVFNWSISTDALLRPELSGGGVLMDTGAHTLDLIAWWFGEAATLDYADDSGGGVEADCVMRCRLAAGGEGNVELSRSRNLPNTCLIEGDNGFVEVHLYQNKVVACSDNVGDFRLDGIGVDNFTEQLFPSLFSQELTDFRADIASDTRRGVAGRDAAHSVRLIERCYQARRPLAYPWLEATPHAPAPALLPAGATAVVTGATGFIGGRLVETLLQQGIKPRCLVRSSASAVRLARLPVEIRRLDLADGAAVDQAINGADFVFHCAHDVRSRSQTLAGAQNILAACARGGIRRLVYVSSFSAYEPFPDGVLSEMTRDGDTSWEYTATKLAIERAVLEAARDGRVAATVIQPTIVYGPFSKPWTITPAEMLLSGRVILPDSGAGTCNAVYVDDVVTAMLLAALRPQAVGERFLVSGPKPVSWRSFFEAFAHTLERPGPEYRPATQIARENSGLMHDLNLVLRNPKTIVQLAVRRPMIRQLAQRTLESLPKSLYEAVIRRYYAPVRQRGPRLHLPDPQLLRLYSAQAVVSTQKAKRLLGYEAAFDFTQGMAMTALYLRWAYPPPNIAHDRCRAQQAPQPSDDFANVA